MTLHPIPSEFPYIWGKFVFFFYQCIKKALANSFWSGHPRTCFIGWTTSMRTFTGPSPSLPNKIYFRQTEVNRAFKKKLLYQRCLSQNTTWEKYFLKIQIFCPVHLVYQIHINHSQFLSPLFYYPWSRGQRWNNFLQTMESDGSMSKMQ